MSECRLVLLNAFPFNAFSYFRDLPEEGEITLAFRRLSIYHLKELVRKYPVVNYIRHPATLQLLNNVLDVKLTPSADIYQSGKRDIVVVVTLKDPERGKEVNNVTIDDLMIYELIFMYPGWWVSDKG